SLDETEKIYQEKINNLQTTLEDARKSPPEYKPLAFDGLWKGLRRGHLEDFDKSVDTSFPIKKLYSIAEPLTSEPKDFNLHPKVKELVESRKKMIDFNQLDWGMAELLSYASLLSEGNPVRLSGQDCERGTFTHRHAVYYDTET